ncbi:LPS export ABC transporter permease LptG [Aurantivibrio plasticivorans]
MMLRRLNRYLGRTVLFATLGTLCILVFLHYLSILVSELRNLDDAYTLSNVFVHSLWLIPGAIYENLTFAAFLGCVIGLGQHANANELVIVRAAGVSGRRVVWIAMRPILALTFLGVLWGEYVTPLTTQLAEGVKASATADNRALDSEVGVWYLDNNAFQFFSGLNRKLYGVTTYQFAEDRKRLLSSSFAKEATYYADGWRLEEGRDSRFVFPESTSTELNDALPYVEQQRFTSRHWETQLTPTLLNDLVLPVEALSIRSLYRYARDRDAQGLESNELWLTFWQKISQPLVVVGLALVGISFIFGSLRESTMGFRLTIAVTVGIVFTVLQDFAAASSLVFGFSALIAVAIPIMFSASIGLWMLRSR